MISNQPRRPSSGFTFVEVTLTTLIVGLAFLGVSTYTRMGDRAASKTESNAKLLGIESFIRNLVFSQMSLILKNAADGCGCERTTTAIDLTKLCRPLGDAFAKVWEEVFTVAKNDLTGTSSGAKTLAFVPFWTPVPIQSSDLAGLPPTVASAVTRCSQSQSVAPSADVPLKKNSLAARNGAYFCLRVAPTDFSLWDSLTLSHLIFVEATITYANAMPGSPAPTCANFTATVPKAMRNLVMHYSIYSRKIRPESARAPKVLFTEGSEDGFTILHGVVSGRMEPAGVL